MSYRKAYVLEPRQSTVLEYMHFNNTCMVNCFIYLTTLTDSPVSASGVHISCWYNNNIVLFSHYHQSKILPLTCQTPHCILGHNVLVHQNEMME